MKDRRAQTILTGSVSWSPEIESASVFAPVSRDLDCQVCKGNIASDANHYCAACGLSGHEFELFRERQIGMALMYAQELMAKRMSRAQIKAARDAENAAKRARGRRGPICFVPRIRPKHARKIA